MWAEDRAGENSLVLSSGHSKASPSSLENSLGPWGVLAGHQTWKEGLRQRCASARASARGTGTGSTVVPSFTVNLNLVHQRQTRLLFLLLRTASPQLHNHRLSRFSVLKEHANVATKTAHFILPRG